LQPKKEKSRRPALKKVSVENYFAAFCVNQIEPVGGVWNCSAIILQLIDSRRMPILNKQNSFATFFLAQAPQRFC
jgi:hypothetical protein